MAAEEVKLEEGSSLALAAAVAAAGEGFAAEEECIDDQYYSSLLKKLVTHKDVVTETFLKEVIGSLPYRDNLSAAELSHLWKEEARKRITKFSVTLSHKLGPLVQIMLDEKLSDNLESTFVEVSTMQPSLHDMVGRYSRCFDTWIDDFQSVSYNAVNTRLLGRVDIKDMFVLTFFVFCTCRRTRYDNILQLGVVGCSTSGKSTLFESCLLEGSHMTTNDQGVGRFEVGHKSILLFHDISIRTLVLSKDTEKIKTIARTEPTVTKIHGSTNILKPLFLFYSSNERLMTHKFLDNLTRQPLQWRSYPGQVNEMAGFGGGGGHRKKATDEHLSAIQNRFIEVFVRKPPKLNPNDLPQSGNFQRIHGILGMYPRIMATMEKYTPDQFFSPVLKQYVLHGLCKNYLDYVWVVMLRKGTVAPTGAALASAIKEEMTSDVLALNTRLRALVDRHIDPSLQDSLLHYLSAPKT